MKNKRGARCGAFEATKKYLFNISYLTKQMAEGVEFERAQTELVGKAVILTNGKDGTVDRL